MNQYHHEEWVGTATITPDTDVVAAEYGSWLIEYTVGASAIDDGGRIRLAFRSVCDWAAPQFSDRSAPDYVSVHTTGRAHLRLEYGTHGVRPWTKTLTAYVNHGELAPGDIVRIVLGDQTYGSPGMRVQTYPERGFHIKCQVDPFGTGIYEPVTDLTFNVIGGKATQLVLIGPSDIRVEEPTWLQIRALDAWGNPDPSYRGTVQFSGDVPEQFPNLVTFTEADAGVRWFRDIHFLRTGVQRIAATDDAGGLSVWSNPIRCHAESPSYRWYWADLHGQTRETVGTGSIDEYFRYARDIAAVDVTAHSGNDFQITNEVYEELRSHAEAFNEPGRFVTFHGYEWSGNTRAGGDRNVYYRNDGPIRRSSHTQIDDRHDIDTDCYPVDQLFAANADRDDVAITPHIGGRRASLEWHDPELEPAIEIASQWGRFEWFAHEALKRGMRVAFIGGSDDHSGRPGWSTATLAHHGTRGGLTAFHATAPTREAIWDALKTRRCYGTSGPRILLDVNVNGSPMGSEPSLTENPVVSVRVNGEAPIDTVEVRRGTATVHVFRNLPMPTPDDPWRVRFAWRGARNRGRSRPLNWTGTATIWNGRFVGATNYAIDNPLDGIQGWNERQVSWASHTCGDWDGVVLDIDGDESTRIDFNSPTIHFSCTLGALRTRQIQHFGPYLEHQVQARLLPAVDPTRDVSFSWEDTLPVPGLNPYWIWVTQTDGELAWSTPVFVWHSQE